MNFIILRSLFILVAA